MARLMGGSREVVEQLEREQVETQPQWLSDQAEKRKERLFPAKPEGVAQELLNLADTLPADSDVARVCRVAALAIEKGVDAIGVSSLAAGHKTLIPELMRILKEKGHSDIKIFAGGVIPEQDYGFLRAEGVSEIFGPGTNVLEAAYAVLADIAGLKRNR